MNRTINNDAPKAPTEHGRTPLAERLDVIARDLALRAQRGGRDMTKDEIDAMWGHESE